jgi:hypothetical protein
MALIRVTQTLDLCAAHRLIERTRAPPGQPLREDALNCALMTTWRKERQKIQTCRGFHAFSANGRSEPG